MQRNNEGNYEVTVSVPEDAEAINLAFHHEEEMWDNNSGEDWMIPVVTLEATTGNVFLVY